MDTETLGLLRPSTLVAIAADIVAAYQDARWTIKGNELYAMVWHQLQDLLGADETKKLLHLELVNL